MCKKTRVSRSSVELNPFELSHRFFRKTIIRGALTSGHDWIFIILKMHPDGNGGVYAESEKIRLMAVFPPGVEQISRTMCATIAGIIAHWASDFLYCY